MMLATAVNALKEPRPSVGATMGHLASVLVFLTVAVWLIASGLPQTLGLDKVQRRVRRRIWYAYVGVGLLVMVAAMLLLGYANLHVGAVLVTWLYWFVWPCIAWLRADRRVIRRFDLTVEESESHQ
jgi:hypothetical protein